MSVLSNQPAEPPEPAQSATSDQPAEPAQSAQSAQPDQPRQPAQPFQPISVVESGGRRTLLVVGIMMAALLQTLDATIVNVALPTIEGNVGASIDDGIWIVTGYIISNVIAIPLAPFLLQRLGRRQYYSTCIIGFTAASVLCGTATTLGELVFYRIVQGAFGGGLIATSQIVLRDTFPPNKVGTSAALFAVALTAGPALGPTLGGLLTDNFSWQWVFDINIVPGIIAATIVLTTLKNPAAPKRLPFDAAGLALLALTLGSMQYVLDEGERRDWFGDNGIVFFSFTCVAGLIGFVVWELFGTKHPIVDLRVFRYRNVRAGAALALMLGMVVFGPIVLLPQYVQNILGFTSTDSGLLLLMRAAPVVLLTPLVARAATRMDARWLLVTGFCISGLSFYLISQRMTPGSDFQAFAGLLAFSGAGQAMLLVPLLVGVLGTVKLADVPKASSFISLSVQLGGSIASTMLVTILDQRTYFHSDVYRSAITLKNPYLNDPTRHLGNLAQVARIVGRQATNAGFADALFALVPVAVVAIGIAIMVRRAPSAQ
jgi:DHA2 family multidrug resistance protein